MTGHHACHVGWGLILFYFHCIIITTTIIIIIIIFAFQDNEHAC